MRRRLAHGLALALLVASLGAAQGPNNSEATPAQDRIAPPQPKASSHTDKPRAYQVGTASWYGEYFDGKPTASGEDYDMYDMTAAHPTLPLGSYVRVTNLRNGKAVVVRVNDRGPVVPDRIIDLSYGAAQALQFREKGLQRVRLDVVKPRQLKTAYPAIAYNHPLVELVGR
jgi:peptidoglycan lytic transglycosylase